MDEPGTTEYCIRVNSLVVIRIGFIRVSQETGDKDARHHEKIHLLHAHTAGKSNSLFSLLLLSWRNGLAVC
jgi:hypothetical protein